MGRRVSYSNFALTCKHFFWKISFLWAVKYYKNVLENGFGGILDVQWCESL